MGNERHSLRKQSFRVSAASEDIALALQARLPDLNRTVLIDIIERVFDSYSSPARHIRIDRLRVDLGTIVLGRNFEEDVTTRLERELRHALDEAVSELERQPSDERFAQSPEAARLDLLEHYLMNGTLPFWAAAPAFDVEALVTETATATPEALVRVLRRHREDTRVIRRLVAQLSDQALRRLLDLIDPDSGGRVSVEIEAARREDRRFATWVRVLTDAVFEHRDAAGGIARDVVQLGRGGDGRGDREGPEAFPFEGQVLSLEGRNLSPAGQVDQSLAEGPDLSRYDRAEAIRYYVRFGVLPWTAALAPLAAGGVPLTVEALLDTLPRLPLSMLRAIFSAPDGECPAPLLRAVERMSASTRASLLAALWRDARPHEVPIDGPTTARVIEQPALYVRTILHLLHGGPEVPDETVESATAPAPGELPALWSNVHWIKSVLAERAKRGADSSLPEISSAALLQVLVEEHQADAEHFFQVLRAAGIAPATLLTEPVSPRLFAGAQMLLPARARTLVALLLRLVSRLPAHAQPGDEGGVRAAVMGALLEHIAVAGRTESSETRASLAAGVLCALFGPVMAVDTVRHLATDAARLARDDEAGAEDQETCSQVLAALGDAPSATVYPRDVETALQDTFAQRIAQLPDAVERRIASLVAIVSAWPPDERRTGDEGIRRAIVRVLHEQARADPLSREFLALVLQAVLMPPVTEAVTQRLIDDVERLAGRGDLTRADVEAIREAAASLADVRAQVSQEAERLSAALRARLDEPGLAQAGLPLSASLLRTLVERFPDEARVFLQRARDAGLRPSTLLTGATAPELLAPVAGLLRPLDRRLVSLILRLVSGLPAPERPGNDDSMRTLIAGVVLDRAGGPSSGEGLAAAALRSLLGPAIPQAVQRRLVSEVERAGRTGQVGPDAVTVLLRVLHRGSGLVFQHSQNVEIQDLTPLPESGEPSAGAAAGRPAFREPGAAESAAALARLRGPAPSGKEARTSGEQPTAAPPRLYQPGRFPVRHTSAAPPGPGEPAMPEKGPAHTGEPENAPGTDGARARLSDDALRHILLELVETSPAAVRKLLVEGLAETSTRDRWVRSFTEPELARIIWLLEPARHHVLIAAAELLFAAWDNAAPRRADASGARKSLWTFLLEALSHHPEGERSVENLVPGFFAHVGAGLAAAGGPRDHGDLAEGVFAEAVRLSERRGHAQLRAVLSQRRAELIALAMGPGRPPSADSGGSQGAASVEAPPPDRVPARASSRQRMAFSMDGDQLEPDAEPIHIANAGLVIVGAFLPHLFTTLDLLEEAPTGGAHVRADAVSRAVHMLQYLVDGRTNAPEPLLCLNKVLCGVSLATPIDREIEMTLRERELCDQLLAAVLAEWTKLKGSSVAALRETYLQREGRLDHLPTGWRLRVQRRTVDVLMDYITWPVATIAHSWMPEPLYVTW